MGDKLSKLNLDARALDAPSPYEIPAHAIAQGSHYDAIGSAAALTELAVWFSNAELLLNRLQGQLIGRKLAASSVCCWPHHFDLATLTTLPKRDVDAIGYLSVGLSPGDNYYDEPYFYVSVNPKPDQQCFQPCRCSAIGTHTNSWPLLFRLARFYRQQIEDRDR